MKTPGCKLFLVYALAELDFTYGTWMASSLYLFVQLDSSSVGLLESDTVPSLGTGSLFISGRSDDYIFFFLVSTKVGHDFLPHMDVLDSALTRSVDVDLSRP